uniref:Taste receptor type 2 n=1 Tax=Pyxicephalus adspersus TaxID=30357 RepID=A0AAV2ZTB2_PYXAD|nr:TPA: hypothetical protein GDO54_004179 [Pyxicephalus adspersus]
MGTSFTLAITAIQIVASFLGIVTNGFMLAVNLLDWKHCKGLNASDYFICAVGFSNLSSQIWSGLHWFCQPFWNLGFLCPIAYALKMISIQCSLVVSSMLCVFYCTRILNLNNALFRFYQRHYQESYRSVIIKSFTVCTMMGWPLLWVQEKPSNLPFSNCTSNFSMSKTHYDIYFGIYRLLVLSFGYTFPLVLTIGSASLILISLLQHTNRMRDAFNTKHEAFIDAHLRAGYTILSILLLFVMYFITAIINIIDILKEGDRGYFICQLVSVIYAPALSIVLIRGNTKLKNAADALKARVGWVLQPKGYVKEDAGDLEV